MNIDVKTLEKELTAYFATVLNLTVDTNIFRGAIPENVQNGVAVRIIGQNIASNIDHPTYRVQVFGKFTNRDDAWTMLTKMAGCLPGYGRETTSYILVNMLPEGEGVTPYETLDNGGRTHNASVVVRVCVLTRGA